jgi:hypothetical protein
VALPIPEGKPSAVDDTTQSYQTALVAPLPRLNEKVLEIRDLPPLSPLDQSEDEDIPAAKMPPQEISDEERRESDAYRAEILSKLTAAKWSEEPAAGFTRFMFADLEARKEYIVEVSDDEIAAIYELAESLGVSSPAKHQPAEDLEPDELQEQAPAMHTRGLSGGQDSRINKGISSTYPATQTSLRRIGQIQGDRTCTGTLVGRRLVLTVAHCVVTASGSQQPLAFRARRSNAVAPFGTENSIGYWWPTAYSTNGCAPNYNAAFHLCAPHDWALVLLREDAWDDSGLGHPLWMGYALPNVAFGVVGPASWHNGYPACQDPDAPAFCIANTLYGQDSTAFALEPQFPDPSDGNKIRFFFSNTDTSGGHSGGPYYTLVNGLPTTRAITATQKCGTCPNGEPFPSGFRAMTPALSGFISAQRAAFP